MTTRHLQLHRSTSHDRAGARSLQRRYRAGLLVRIAHGVFADAEAWRSLNSTERHLVLARALAPRLRPTAAFSHMTAALAYGWPSIAGAPTRVHVTDGATQRTEHRAQLVRHAGMPELGADPRTFDGVALTSVLRTAVDLATTLEPAVATVAVDHAVRSGALVLEAFIEALPEGPRRGSIRSRMVAAALDPKHESPGESYASIRMVELGLPRPIAQKRFRHTDGSVDRVDFWFEELGVIVEFDGKQKYSDPDLLGGRSPAQALWHEKIREDRLRAIPEVRTVIRPTWWHLVDPDRLRALFRQHRVVF